MAIKMVKRYIKFAIWEETLNNFRLKKTKIDADLKSVGIRRTMPLTRIIHMASTKPIFLDTADIRKISRRKKFEI